MSRAAEQRFASTEEKVRNLQGRAYRGAVRTASAPEAAPGVYASLVSVVEVIVPSGRWIVSGIATFSVPAPSGTVDLYLVVGCSDPDTDDVWVGADYDTPADRYLASHSTALVRSSRCSADIIHVPDDNVKVALLSMNAVGDAYTLTDVRLTLNPA